MKVATNKLEDLQQIVNDLTLGDYNNMNGPLLGDPAFAKLVYLAGGETVDIANEDDLELADTQVPDEPFHIEADIYDSGDYANLLVIPTNGSFVVVGNNEHLATVIKTCSEPACWEQQDGSLEDDVIEKLGNAIDDYLQSF